VPTDQQGNGQNNSVAVAVGRLEKGQEQLTKLMEKLDAGFSEISGVVHKVITELAVLSSEVNLIKEQEQAREKIQDDRIKNLEDARQNELASKNWRSWVAPTGTALALIILVFDLISQFLGGESLLSGH
jgi:hypothetical protein